jgi:hypothetical protein
MMAAQPCHRLCFVASGVVVILLSLIAAIFTH